MMGVPLISRKLQIRDRAKMQFDWHMLVKHYYGFSEIHGGSGSEKVHIGMAHFRPGDFWWKKWLRCRYRPSLSLHALREYLSSTEVANDPPLGLNREGDEVRMIQWCISGTYDIVWWYNETPFLHIFTYNQWFMRDLYLPGWRFEPPDSQVAIQIRILGARVLRNWGSFVHHSCDIEPVATWHLNSKKCNQPKPL